MSLRRAIISLRHKWLLLAGLVVSAGLLLYRLTTVPVAGLLSLPEYNLASDGGNWHALLHDPFFLPYRLVGWLGRYGLANHQLLALRLPSVIVALLALLCLAYLFRRWYGPRTAFFGFVIVASSALFLHVGRLATVDIVYFAALPLLLLAHVALSRETNHRTFFGWLLVSVLLLYVPGMVWFVLLQAVWQRQLLAESLQNMRQWWLRALAVAVILLGLTPLVYGFIKNLNAAYALQWLGLPSSLPNATEILKNTAASLGFIFVRTPEDPSRWLGRLPLLTAFLVVCLLAGVFFYAVHWRAERTRLLASVGVLSVALLAAGGPVVRSLLVPLIYIVTLGGLAFLLHYWLGMFPRNVTARWLGITVVCIALALTVTFDLRHYYVAWPHNTDTVSAFTYKPPQ